MEIKNRIIGIIIGIVFIIGIITFYYTFSLGDNYQFSSDVYLVENGYIKGISPYTDISLYKKYFDYDSCYIKVFSNSNVDITNGYVYNGSKTVLYDDNDHVISSFINIVYGDYYADGIIDDKDFSFFGKYLVYGNSLENYEKEALDIDKDGSVRINDLTLLRDASINGVSGLTSNKEEILLQTNEKYRLVVKASPGYGVNSNLKWTSSNTNVANVNNAGVVTGGSVEGNAVIRAETQDGNKYVEIEVTLDNTIQLASSSGVAYVNGDDVAVNIKSVTYDDLTCSVSNTSVGSCRIAGKKLIITGLADGSAEVHVNSNLYNGTVYYLQSHTVYFNVLVKYLCKPFGGSSAIRVSGFNSGDLSFSSTDSAIIRSASMELINGVKMLRITAGDKAGRAFVTVSENHAYTSNIVTVDVYHLTLEVAGKQMMVGENAAISINGENVGTLSCTSGNESIATCSIENNKLIVNAVGVGNTNITIKNTINFEGDDYNCSDGFFPFVVVVRE